MAQRGGTSGGAWLVLLAAVCWGSTGTAQAFAPLGATPPAVGAVRLAVGGAALLLWAVARRAFRADRRWSLRATLAAAACMAAYQLCFFAGVARTGVAVGTVVAIGSAPVLAGVFGWWLRRERPGRAWAVATVLAVTGCALLSLAGGQDPSGVTLDAAGVLLAVGAGGSYALFTVLSKELVAQQRPEAAMGVIFSLGALMLSPLFFVLDFAWLREGRGLLVALHLGLVTTALAYVLFAQGLLSTSVATAATLTLGEPLTAALLGLLVLRESVTAVSLVGMALIGIGLLALARGTGNSRRTAAPETTDFPRSGA